MITPSFYLKAPKAEESSIYMGIRLHDKKLFKYYTKYKIYPELFDKGTKRPTTNTKLINEYKTHNPNIKADLMAIKEHLNTFEKNTEDAIRDIIRESQIVTKEALKEKLDKIYKLEPTDNKEKITFLDYLDSFIEGIENGSKTHNTKKYKKGTIKTYRTFKNKIESFNKKLKFDDIDMDFYKKFVGYLNKLNYSTNSIGKNIKFIKVIMKDAYENGLHKNLIYTYKDFKAVSEKVDDVYLTKHELDVLYNLDLSHKPNYELARDVFLVGCYTALRFSDYSTINDKQINKKGYIELHTKKTNTKVSIPLSSKAKKILKKYNYSFPKTYEQKINKYIKEVCKIAGINDNIEITKIIGGEIETYTKPKYELIKTHTARRTGATLMYLAKIPPIEIMKITGHTREQNLMKYIKITNEEVADRLAKNPFFQ